MSRPRGEFLAIGSELLDPWRHDTNGSYVALRLGEIGISLRFRTVVGDAPEDLEEAFRVALGRSDLVVATGGLGPTVDDLTREALASVLGLRLREDPSIVRLIEERFRRLGRPMVGRNRRQALVPEAAEVLPNRLGSAPGLLVRSGRATVALLPGVPSEMRAMLDEVLMPRLGPTGERFVYRVLKIAGLTESEVDDRLTEVHRGAGEVAWTILAGAGQIEIHLRERVTGPSRPAGIERLEREIERLLGSNLFARDDETMESVIGRLLMAAGATLATAESITAGGISRRVTSVAGSSRYFRGGIVCYSDEAKVRILGVSREAITFWTAVSGEVAAEMASGCRSLLEATWGLSATGYAGPEGGGESSPPGTVFLAASGPTAAVGRRLTLPGERELVRERAVQAALDLLRRLLLGGAEAGPAAAPR